MVNKHRWVIYPYETLSDILPKLCVKKDPYTIVANVLFHCSDLIFNNNTTNNNSSLHSKYQIFHDEYSKSLINIYSNSSFTKNGSAEFILSPLNTNIVEQVSPRITSLPFKRLKSLLYESLYNFGIFHTLYKERIDINGLLPALGLKDYLEAIEVLRLHHKLINLTSHNVDSLLDYHTSLGQNGRIQSIKFITHLINENSNLDTLINHSNWSLERLLSEITKSECQVSFNQLINAIKYKKLLTQLKEFLEYKDENTGLLKSVWGYSMRDFISERLQLPERVEITKSKLDPDSVIESDTIDKAKCIKWDSDRNSFVIHLINDSISIKNRKFTYVDSIATLEEIFDYLVMAYISTVNSSSKNPNSHELNLSNPFKIGGKFSLHVEYHVTKNSKVTTIKPSILALTVNMNESTHSINAINTLEAFNEKKKEKATNEKNGDLKIFLIDLFNLDPSYMQLLYNMLYWTFLSPYVIKLGHNIRTDVAYLGEHLKSFSSFTGLNNVYDIRSPRSLQVNDNSNTNELNPLINEWNYENCSLNKMIASVLGINMPTISNWDSRPLSPMNLQYAALRSSSISDIDNLLLDNGWTYNKTVTL